MSAKKADSVKIVSKTGRPKSIAFERKGADNKGVRIRKHANEAHAAVLGSDIPTRGGAGKRPGEGSHSASPSMTHYNLPESAQVEKHQGAIIDKHSATKHPLSHGRGSKQDSALAPVSRSKSPSKN